MLSFLERLRSGDVLLMDGGMGTELQKLGLRLAEGENGTAWNILHPERVRQVHQDYWNAGARVGLTNTFGVNERSLIDALPSGGSVNAIKQKLWRAACELNARSDGYYRIAGFGPVTGTYEDGELSDLTQLCAKTAAFEGVDAVLLETCSTPRVWDAVKIFKNGTALPLLLSLTYQREESGEIRSLSGHAPSWFAAHAEASGVAALGVNCGRDLGIKEIVTILKQYRQETDLPLFARPNAGTPTIDADCWTFPLTPAMLAAGLPEILEAGAVMVGGCCGTTPAHVAAMKPVVDAWNARRKR